MRRMLRPPAPLLLLVAALVLSGCGGDDASSAEAGAAVPTADAPSEPEPEVAPDDAQVVAVTVAGGKASGDTGRVQVAVGTTVRLTVTSDAADQVHVHGYDLVAPVSPGQATQLEFVAERPGVYEVELHDARQVVTRLQIS